MKTRKSNIWVTILGVIALIGILIMSIYEINIYSNQIEWEPTEVYEFTNKNIDWL